MVEDPGDYERRDWAPAKDARRFECGSPNMLGIHALEASLSLLEETGLDAVWEGLRFRTDYTIEQIERAGYRLLTPRDPARRAGIVTFSVPGAAPDALHRALLARRVLCAPRGGGIRFSPHFYTPLEVIDRAIAVVSEVAQGFHS
jgi:selenocysteine lyase/cysteine desulfurase